MKTYNLFVSYSHKDREQVIEIIDELHKRGYSVLYDSSMSAGDNWKEKAKRYMTGTESAMFVMSDHSFVSAPVLTELEIADSRKINGYFYFPFLLDNEPLDRKFRRLKPLNSFTTDNAITAEGIQQYLHQDVLYIMNDEHRIDNIIDCLNKNGILPNGGDSDDAGFEERTPIAEQKPAAAPKHRAKPANKESTNTNTDSRHAASSRKAGTGIAKPPEKATASASGKKKASGRSSCLEVMLFTVLLIGLLIAAPLAFHWPAWDWLQWVVPIVGALVLSICSIGYCDEAFTTVSIVQALFSAAVILTMIALPGSFKVPFIWLISFSALFSLLNSVGANDARKRILPLATGLVDVAALIVLLSVF